MLTGNGRSSVDVSREHDPGVTFSTDALPPPFFLPSKHGMPMNNNQGQSAAARLAKLPMVHSVCTKLSVMYTDTKNSHSKLRSVCEGLESGVTALLSPVIVKLEPHVSIANNIACKGLDWLEASFPVLHTPTEQIVATVMNKMHELQDLVSTAANGSVGCMHMALMWLTGVMQQTDHQSLVQRAVGVTNKGLNFVVNMSEALVDGKLPSSGDNKETDAAHKQLEGFVVTTSPSYRGRLVSMASKTYGRTCHRVMTRLSRSPVMIQVLQSSWQTLAWNIQGLPKYIKNQLVSLLFFVFQMYYLFSPPSHNYYPNKENFQENAEASTHKEVFLGQLQTTLMSHHMRRPTRSPLTDKCNVKGCVGR